MGFANEATVHGFRSSFKNWCAEVAGVRDEISEAALAHKIPDKVRAAYLRTDFFDQRRSLMKSWAHYCANVEAFLADDRTKSRAGVEVAPLVK